MWQHLTLYPDVPSARRSQILRDLLVVGLVILFVWVGVKVHDLVAALAVLGHGITETGNSVQGAFDSVGNAVSNVPIVGGALGGAFHGAGDGTGGNLADLGQPDLELELAQRPRVWGLRRAVTRLRVSRSSRSWEPVRWRICSVSAV